MSAWNWAAPGPGTSGIVSLLQPRQQGSSRGGHFQTHYRQDYSFSGLWLPREQRDALETVGEASGWFPSLHAPYPPFPAWRGQSPSLFPIVLPGLQAGKGCRLAHANLLHLWCLPLLRLRWGPSSSLEHSPSHHSHYCGLLNSGKCVSWTARWSVKHPGLSHTEKTPGGGHLKTRNEDLASFCWSSNWTMMTGETLQSHLGNIFRETCAALREEARQLQREGGGRLCFLSHVVLFVLAVYSTVKGLIANCSDKAKSSHMRWAGHRLPAHSTAQTPAISGLGVCKTDACPLSWVVWNYAVVWWSQQITRTNHTGGNKKAAGIGLVFRRQ